VPVPSQLMPTGTPQRGQTTDRPMMTPPVGVWFSGAMLMSATSRAADAAPDLHCPPPREAEKRKLWEAYSGGRTSTAGGTGELPVCSAK
jgi:hypothetical protein